MYLTIYWPFLLEEVLTGHQSQTSLHLGVHSLVSALSWALSQSPKGHRLHGPSDNTQTTKCHSNSIMQNRQNHMLYAADITRWDQRSGVSLKYKSKQISCGIQMYLVISCSVMDTFCMAVRSSARQVAKFLAHWPSCIAAACSATVGTADFADATILLPGWQIVTEI